jgi:hypothetical protein
MTIGLLSPFCLIVVSGLRRAQDTQIQNELLETLGFEAVDLVGALLKHRCARTLWQI